MDYPGQPAKSKERTVAETSQTTVADILRYGLSHDLTIVDFHIPTLGRNCPDGWLLQAENMKYFHRPGCGGKSCLSGSQQSRASPFPPKIK
jgi:hypothetical protein